MRFQYELAEKFGMPRWMFLRLVPSDEMAGWIALYRVRHSEQVESERNQAMLSRLSANMARQRKH